MAKFLDKTGLNSLWRRIKEALPFRSVSISGDGNGWLKIAQVRCVDSYLNTPIVFHLICRGFPASSVEIMLLSEDGTTPGVKYFVHRTTLLEGSHGLSSNVGYTYADVDGVRTYTLWKKKNERYGVINVHAECSNGWTKYISYETGISYTEPEGIVYAEVRYDHVQKQTAYSAKGSATKIPRITTNAAGQVTLIDEVDIGNAPTATNPLATKLTASDDLNNVKGDGRGVWWYYWTSSSVPANAHSNATTYMEVVRMHGGDYLFQTVYEANTSHLYRRQCRNGTWDGWYRYAEASTTLSGYGITNAYTKTEVDGMLDGKSPTSHTHKVKINGNEKTIAAPGGTAVDLGTYLTAHQDISGKVNKTVITLLADWNTLDETGIYEVESQASNVAHSPEPGKLACYVTVVAGYITQLAVGDRVYKRCMPAGTQVWENWVVLQDSSGLTVNELYTTSAGGYVDIRGAKIEAGGSAGTTEITGGGISTPSLLVNGKSITQKSYTSYTGQTTSMSSAQNSSVRVLSKSSGIQLGKKMMFCMSFRMLNMNIPVGSYKLFEFRLYNKEQTAQDSRGQLLGGQTVIVGTGDNNCVIEIPFTWTSGSFGIGVNMFWDSSYTVSSNESVVIENGDAFLYQIEN